MKQDGYFIKDRDPGENNVWTTDCDWTMAKGNKMGIL